MPVTAAPGSDLDVRGDEKMEMARLSPEWVVLANRWAMAKALGEPTNSACPDALRGKAGAIFQILSIGAELGLPPMTALMHLYVVHGKVGQDAQTMRALVRRAGHQFEWRERGEERCVVAGKRADDGSELEVTWTMEDAKRADLIKDGGAWETYPRAMLAARATAELCRALFEDVLGGVSYTPGELGAAEIVDIDPQ